MHAFSPITHDNRLYSILPRPLSFRWERKDSTQRPASMCSSMSPLWPCLSGIHLHWPQWVCCAGLPFPPPPPTPHPPPHPLPLCTSMAGPQAPEEDYFSAHIRVVGDWTEEVARQFGSGGDGFKQSFELPMWVCWKCVVRFLWASFVPKVLQLMVPSELQVRYVQREGKCIMEEFILSMCRNRFSVFFKRQILLNCVVQSELFFMDTSSSMMYIIIATFHHSLCQKT